jgi:hypothetical protein
MSYVPHVRDFGSVATRMPANDDAAAKRPGILRRIFDAFIERRQRDVDRQIASFLQRDRLESSRMSWSARSRIACRHRTGA